MATRSLIGTYDSQHDWRMRYVHWDGHPDTMGKTLCTIIKRDGMEAAVRSLVTDALHGWSSLDAHADTNRPGYSESHRIVPGYGYAYTDGDDGYVYRSDDMDCEWAYVMMMHNGHPMIDVYAHDFQTSEWELRMAMDCRTGITLSVDNTIGRVA